MSNTSIEEYFTNNNPYNISIESIKKYSDLMLSSCLYDEAVSFINYFNDVFMPDHNANPRKPIRTDFDSRELNLLNTAWGLFYKLNLAR